MSDLYVYNAETRSKEHFEPIVANEIKLYVCGITVYGNPPINNRS